MTDATVIPKATRLHKPQKKKQVEKSNIVNRRRKVRNKEGKRKFFKIEVVDKLIESGLEDQNYGSPFVPK